MAQFSEILRIVVLLSKLKQLMTCVTDMPGDCLIGFGQRWKVTYLLETTTSQLAQVLVQPFSRLHLKLHMVIDRTILHWRIHKK